MKSAINKRQIRLNYVAECFVQCDKTMRQLQDVMFLLSSRHSELSRGPAVPSLGHGPRARVTESMPAINS